MAFLLSGLGITPAWYALLWLINLMPGMLLAFQRDNWLSNIVPGNMLGRYLGQRLAIKSAFYLGAFCCLGYMMDKFGGENLVNFAFVFIVALVMALVDYVIFTFMRESDNKGPGIPEQEAQKTKFGLFDFIGELKEKKLDTFIIFTSFFYLTVGLSGPLYAVYMLQERHFTYLSYTVIFAAEYLARVVSVPFWGRFADKAGNIRVLGIVSRIIPVIPICWLFCSNIGYLAFVQVLSGICWGAFDLCNQSYLYKVAPREKKLRYIVYTRCLILLSTAIGGLLGAYLVKGIFFTFGSRLLSIFLISGFFRAIVVMYLMPKLVDLAVSYGKPPSPPEANLAVLRKAITSRRGLYYRIREQAEIPAIACVSKKETTPVLKKTAHMRRRNWALAETPKKIEKEVNNTNLPPVARRAWYYPHDTPAPSETSKPATSSFKVNRKKSASRQGLYYDRVGWTNYMKETLQAVLRESRQNKASTELRPVFAVNSSGIFRGIRTQGIPFNGA